MSAKRDRANHPCFNRDKKHDCGRVHLPVAPKCNILCNFCLRKFDCVNESRPGVTSKVLTPSQAISYLEQVLEKEPRLTVAGIAGPGDPMANPEETLSTLMGVKEKFPQMMLCLASNGLAVPQYLDRIAEAGITHMSLTVNAVDPDIGAKVYRWVRDGNVVYRGYDAAALLWERQQAAIAGLKERGIAIKVNTIVITGLNDHHVLDIADTVAALGVDIQNCMPLFPTAGTPLADTPEPTPAFMAGLRKEADKILTQMTHCRRCRADAVGLLDDDRSAEFMPLMMTSPSTEASMEQKPYVAVASMEGVLINQHLGEAQRFQIWEQTNGDYQLVEERPAPEPGIGPQRWDLLSQTLSDCRAVLVAALGESPRKALELNGIIPVEMEGFITEGLEAVFSGRDINGFRRRKRGLASSCCGGNGEGC
jgi:nitrogen fixation protein NifB